MEATFDKVGRDERARIESQRLNRGDSTKTLSGLAISGGGIRSASFALGVLQALARFNVVRRLDYLSTVSGGGYIGSCWTWFNYLYAAGSLGDRTDSYFFPFGTPGQGARTSEGRFPNRILSWLRQHGDYLVPGHGINWPSSLAVVLRNVVLTLSVFVSLMVAAYVAIATLDARFGGLIKTGLAATALASGVVLLLGILFGPVSFFLHAGSEVAYRSRLAFQRWMGRFAVAAIVLFVVALPPLFMLGLEHAIAGASITVSGLIGGCFHFFRQQRGMGGLSVVALISSLLVLFGLLTVAWYLASTWPELWPILLGYALVMGWFVDLNQFGLDRMYRDRLMEAFLPNPDAVLAGRWAAATMATGARLGDMCGADDQGPYHLINTNLILADDDDRQFRARGGDNFVLSPLYCGGDATGWVSTKEMGELTLATSMATSGAAINPAAGPDSTGLTRNPLISCLMFLLGFRLGVYLPNPAKGGPIVPNLFNPGVFQGLLGYLYRRTSRFLALSDGGHFENTGAYELIRRRVDTIIVSEAGEDQQYTFVDIADLIEKVRVDFGVSIRFLPEYDLGFLMPGSSDAPKYLTDRYDLAQRGFAVAEIEYPVQGGESASTGTIIFIKATLVDNLSGDLYGYKDAFPSFPNETTADQFFDESKVEAYRELGYQLTSGMLADKEFKRWWGMES